MKSTANIRSSDFLLRVSQGRKMDQAGGDSHCINLPHQEADPFFIPKDIREIGEFTSHIVVGDAQVIPMFMPSGEDAEIRLRPLLSASYHPFPTPSRMISHVQVSLWAPLLGYRYNPCPLSEIPVADSS